MRTRTAAAWVFAGAALLAGCGDETSREARVVTVPATSVEPARLPAEAGRATISFDNPTPNGKRVVKTEEAGMVGTLAVK